MYSSICGSGVRSRVRGVGSEVRGRGSRGFWVWGCRMLYHGPCSLRPSAPFCLLWTGTGPSASRRWRPQAWQRGNSHALHLFAMSPFFSRRNASVALRWVHPVQQSILAQVVHVQVTKRVFPDGTRVAGPPLGPLVHPGPLHGGYRCGIQ